MVLVEGDGVLSLFEIHQEATAKVLIVVARGNHLTETTAVVKLSENLPCASARNHVFSAKCNKSKILKKN